MFAARQDARPATRVNIAAKSFLKFIIILAKLPNINSCYCSVIETYVDKYTYLK